MQPKVIQLPYTYKKSDIGVAVKNLNEIEALPDSIDTSLTSLVTIQPQGFGGNHKHPRIEIFSCPTSNLLLQWLDESGEIISIEMEAEKDESMQFYLIPAQLPHVVINQSDSTGILLEYANEPQHDVIPVKIY